MKNSVVTDILICNDAVFHWQFLGPGSWFIPRQRRIRRHDSSSSCCPPQPLQLRPSRCPFSWYPSWRHLSSSVAVDLASSSWNPRPKYPTVSRAGLLSVPYWHWQYYTIIVLSLLISVFVPLRCCVRCDRCSCDVAGSLSHFCDVTTGRCPCKNLTTSRNCGQCVPGSSNLDFANPLGCSRGIPPAFNLALSALVGGVAVLCPCWEEEEDFA